MCSIYDSPPSIPWNFYINYYLTVWPLTMNFFIKKPGEIINKLSNQGKNKLFFKYQPNMLVCVSFAPSL